MIGSGGLDRIVESNRETKNIPPDFDEKRRECVCYIISLLGSIFVGVCFGGCSSKGSEENIEFKPQNPLQAGYKLIYPENTKPVPDDVIPHIVEIGKKYFEVWAPGDLTCYIKGRKEDITSTEVRPGMIIIDFSTENGYNWVIGDTIAHSDHKTGFYAVKIKYFKELSSDIDFVNKYMGVYGALFIEGASGDKAYGSYTFIERGGGKVASFVYVQDLNDPKNYEHYAFHSKEKLDKMWIEIASTHKGRKPHGDYIPLKLELRPEEWYKIPDEAFKKWHPGFVG